MSTIVSYLSEVLREEQCLLQANLDLKKDYLIQENCINYLDFANCTDHHKHSIATFHLGVNPGFHSSLCAYFSATKLESSEIHLFFL